jgi:hypothetical protein
MEDGMSAPDFADIIQVVEYERTRDVNKLLETGWKLLNIYNRPYGDSGVAQLAVYILGWPRSAGEPVNPVQIQEQQQRQEAEQQRLRESPQCEERLRSADIVSRQELIKRIVKGIKQKPSE